MPEQIPLVDPPLFNDTLIHYAHWDDVNEVIQIMRAWPSHFVDNGIDLAADAFNPSRTYIARVNGIAVGFVIWTVTSNDIELEWMAVLPQYTGRGIGAKLVQAVLENVTTQSTLTLLTATLDSEIP